MAGGRRYTPIDEEASQLEGETVFLEDQYKNQTLQEYFNVLLYKDLAANKNKFSEQLKYTQVFQPQRLFFNTSSWFYRSQEDFKKATKGKLTSFDVGVYYPLKGLSNNELASVASSQHLCQGFGRLSTRGSQNEYVEFLKGKPLKDKNDIFSGINTTWNRLKNGGEIGDILYDIEKSFDFVNPSKHLPALLKAYNKIKKLEDKYWVKIKEKQILEIIEGVAGLYLEASAVSSSAIPNASIDVNFEVLNRSNFKIALSSVKILSSDKKILKNLNLIANKRVNFKETIVTDNVSFSDPYWLRKEASLGMYEVENKLASEGKKHTHSITWQLQMYTVITLTFSNLQTSNLSQFEMSNDTSSSAWA